MRPEAKLEKQIAEIVGDAEAKQVMALLAAYPFSGDDCPFCGYDLRSGHKRGCFITRFPREDVKAPEFVYLSEGWESDKTGQEQGL